MECELPNSVRVTPSTRIRFKCTGCGECCRHVKATVPVDTQDVFRLTRYLCDKGEEIYCMDQFLDQYTDPALLNECGFFVFFLKSVGENETCILLKDSRCAVHAAKPLACRLYPYMVEPNESGECRYLYSREREHHFRGPVIETRSWMKKYFPKEDRTFLQEDYSRSGAIAMLLRRIPNDRKTEALFHFYRLRYSEYDLDKPFLEQFRDNQEKLVKILSGMTD